MFSTNQIYFYIRQILHIFTISLEYSFFFSTSFFYETHRHPGIVSLIRFCGETLQAAQEDMLGLGGNDGSGGGGGKRGRRGNSRSGGSRRNRNGGDSKQGDDAGGGGDAAGPEPDFESELLRKGDERNEARAAKKRGKDKSGKSGKSGGKGRKSSGSRESSHSRNGSRRSTSSSSREKPRSAGNDAMDIGGGNANFEGFESFALEGVTQILNLPEEEEEEEEEESDHPFDEDTHDSDDEETKVKFLFFFFSFYYLYLFHNNLYTSESTFLICTNLLRILNYNYIFKLKQKRH